MTEQREDTRNVTDYYKYWTVEAIKADLETKAHNFSVLVLNDTRDFNLGTVIRNANAFCAKEVIVYGKKKYDKRGTVGAHLYTNLRKVRFCDELDLRGAVVVGVDNLDGAVPIETFEWPRDHVIMVFGQESTGLTQEMIDLCNHMVYIEQYGSVRSLNVGCASAIAFFSYCLQHGRKYREDSCPDYSI
jgi:tRNA G18 (ribose-2'-O)-methylase SpoU